MKLIVLVKQVPETDALTLDPETGTVVRSENTAIVNPLDLYALEAALRVKDADPGTRILALSMGPPSAETALREALAMGCDEAVLVTGREFAGADTWATARAIAAAVNGLGGADIVLAGEKATDGDTGQVGPEVAAFLGLPVLSYSGSLEVLPGGGPGGGQAVRAWRVVEEGRELVESSCPLVMTFCKDIGEPRLPRLSGKKRAHEVSIRKLGIAELGLDPAEAGSKGSPTKVVKIESPKLSRETEFLDARTEEGLRAACARIVDVLLEDGFIRKREGRAS